MPTGRRKFKKRNRKNQKSQNQKKAKVGTLKNLKRQKLGLLAAVGVTASTRLRFFPLIFVARNWFTPFLCRQSPLRYVQLKPASYVPVLYEVMTPFRIYFTAHCFFILFFLLPLSESCMIPTPLVGGF
jgi:hypothetical protein